jgi:hypothetical protein
MRALRRQVEDHNVYRWAGELLADAAAVRTPRVDAIAIVG